MEETKVVSRAKAYLKVRQKRVRDAMKALKLDALLLTHTPDLAYLTNFTGDDSVGLITEKEFVIVTDFRSLWPDIYVRLGAVGALLVLYIGLGSDSLQMPVRDRLSSLGMFLVIAVLFA